MHLETWSWGTQRLVPSWPAGLPAPTTIRVSRWGHYGTPILLLPSAGGDSTEVERFKLIETLKGPIENGRIKVFSLDGLTAHPWLHAKAPPAECVKAQRAWESLVYEEVMPLIRRDCNSDIIEIYAAGAAFGGCSALGLICHYPDAFRGAIAMSPTFNLPIQWPEGRQLTQLRQRYVQLACGEGTFERPAFAREFEKALSARGVPNHLDLWGRQYAHGWATWREMLSKYVTEID